MTPLEDRIRGTEIAELECFAKLPYHGRAVAKWTWFMKERMRLAGCYRSAVAKALAAGKWRSKAHPMAWVRSAAEAETIKQILGKSEDHKYFDPAHPPRLRTVSEIRKRDDSGNLMHHDAIIEALEPKEPGLSNGRTVGIRHAGDLTGDIDRPLRYDPNPRHYGAQDCYTEDIEDVTYRRIDWDSFRQKAALDFDEMEVLKGTKGAGVSRDALIARQPDEKKRKRFQAAARRLARKKVLIIDALRASVIEKDGVSNLMPEPVENLRAKNGRYVPPGDVLRSLAMRHGDHSEGGRYQCLPVDAKDGD